MRLTVGPLPPAVYWRRRAVVVATLLVVGWLVVEAGALFLGGPSSGKASRAVQGPSLSPSAVGGPGGRTSAGGAGAGGAGQGGGPGAVSSAPAVADAADRDTGGTPVDSVPTPVTLIPPVVPGSGDVSHAAATCSDGDIALVAGVEPQVGPYGGTYALSLVISNTSGRECARDIGSGPQELRVLSSGNLVWSSDACGRPQRADVRTFGPNAAVRYSMEWSSFHREPGVCSTAASPAPPGSYQVVARLGDKVSAPAGLNIRQ